MIINVDEIAANVDNNLDIDSISEFDFNSIFSHISTTLIYDNNSNNDNVNKLIDQIISKFDNMEIRGYLFTDNKSKYGKADVISDNYDIFSYKESKLDYILDVKNDIIEKDKSKHLIFAPTYPYELTQFIIFDNCYMRGGNGSNNNTYQDYDCIDGTIKDLINNNTSYQFYLIFIDRQNSYMPPSLRFNIDYVFIYNNDDEYNGILFSYFGSEFQKYNIFIDTSKQIRSRDSYLVVIKNSLKYYNNEKIFYYDFNETNLLSCTEDIINKCLDEEYVIVIDI